MITIKKLTRKSSCCPTQWEGRTDDDRLVYIRFRSGRLQVTIGHNVADTLNDVVNDGGIYFRWQSEDRWLGVMSDDKLKDLLANDFIIDCEVCGVC